MKSFPTLAAAGRELAASLTEFSGSTNTIVLAIVSGGVVVAAEVASRLNLSLELLFIRRLLAPSGPQDVLCAFNVAGTLIVDEGVASVSRSPATGLEYAVADGLQQLRETVRACRGDHAPVRLDEKTVIIVDNGIHTGSTMLAAIRAVRKSEVKQVVVAVPVADPNSRAVVAAAADAVVCLAWPTKFGHVGLWYEEFVRPTEDEILHLYLASAREKRRE